MSVGGSPEQQRDERAKLFEEYAWLASFGRSHDSICRELRMRRDAMDHAFKRAAARGEPVPQRARTEYEDAQNA